MSKRDRQFRPVAVPDVDLGGFWGKWQDAVSDATAEILLDRCEKAGMIKAIDIDQPSPGVVIPIAPWGGSTQMFWDSDLGKSIETIAYSLYRKPNPHLEARADAIIDLYGKLQGEDGYLNAWFQRVQPDRRWTNLRDHHELYCAGHLIEAAVAYYQATGKRKLLDIMCRYVDYMLTVFGYGEGQMAGYCGHEEIELALVKLARVTGENKYLELSKLFIDERGTEPHFFTEEAIRDSRDAADFHQKTYEYGQAHQPVRDQRKVVGHAVRAMYLYSGMADIATEYKDDSLTAALDALWDDVVTKQMYITGGIGPSAGNEGFTDYFDLPNETAYAETCASVGLVFWASRMLGRGPDRRYADVMEQALYNGALPGLSTDGKTFFYDNPLESAGKHHRWVWHHCPCCPPNIARLVASIGSYMYATSEDEIAVHLYGESTVRCELENGAKVALKQTTNYPWEGTIAFTAELLAPARFALSLRIPEWAEGATLSVNGTMIDLAADVVDGYARIERQWHDGDRVALILPLALRPQFASPRVRQDVGRVALMRGPLVYCVETTDNGNDLNAIILPRHLPTAETTVLDNLNGAVAVDLDVIREDTADWGQSLYRKEPARNLQGEWQQRRASCRIISGTTANPAKCWSGFRRRNRFMLMANGMNNTSVALRDVRKSYGSLQVIHGIDLTVAEGEFVVFVGPSGCGKSTLLRMIAGLEEVTDGEIEIKGRDVTDLDPSDRGIAMVFQSYALYPHMSVRDNLAFGLRMSNTPRAEIERRVAHASGILKIDPLLGRRPGQLSGGQRQRVAIGRAIVREPDVFLFDEPLSNLDAELRVSMRIEIARLHRQLGNTMVYVTHDQTEAMTLADKIVVLRDGRVEQIGTPRKVYEDPDNVFVAGFIGSPRMNLLKATKDDDGTIKLAGATLSGLPADAPLADGDGLIFGIRPEHIELSTGGSDSFGARVDFNEYLGSTQYLYCTLDDGQSLIVERREGDDVESGSWIQLTAPVSKRRFFQESGERIR